MSYSRRNFLKTGVVSSAALAGASTLASCSTNPGSEKKELFPFFKGGSYSPGDGVSGLLFSQLGYETGMPVRVIVRLPQKDLLPESAKCILTPTFQEKELKTECIYWGEIWKSHWWVAEFPAVEEEGEWDIQINSGTETLIRDFGLKVKKSILWDSTFEWSSVDMLKRRRPFPGVGAGWQDAGSLWAESPAQSAAIIMMEEMLENKNEAFSEEFKKRLYEEIEWGCNYLVMTREKAEELGYAKGAMSHDVLTHQKDILPHDVSKAVLALLKAVKLLPDSYEEKKQIYEKTALESYRWLRNEANPMGAYGYVKMQRGLADDARIPEDEWPTRDLLTLLAVTLELMKLGKSEASSEASSGAMSGAKSEAKSEAIEYARIILARQVPEKEAMNGYYGHFYEFDSMDHAEPSWTHGIVPGDKGSQFGTDMGGIYPNYLIPLIELLSQFPEHEDAEKWKQCLSKFAYGYLIPGCEANPFFLVPQVILKDEGPIWFCGTFHGTNCIYGYTAALALELDKVLGDPRLRDIAYGNLQWVAGLNSGITKDALEQGCVIFSADVPEGVALPASMICHIGARWAGTWFQTRGVVCNGFSTGEQFKYDTKPLKENDGPFSLTDEDWIPHSAGWLTGLMRL